MNRIPPTTGDYISYETYNGPHPFRMVKSMGLHSTGDKHPKILVVRREQIGDLVCTTPLIRTLRNHFPSAFIACLVNSYAAEVLEGNPDIDAVYVYTKPRHSTGFRDSVRAGACRLRLFLALLMQRFDYAILATTPYLRKDMRLLKSIFPRQIVALANEGNPVDGATIPSRYEECRPLHIVEKLDALATSIGARLTPLPPVKVFPNCHSVAAAKNFLSRLGPLDENEIIGVHISARAPSQRWPADNFVKLMQELHRLRGCRFLLFWSPGEDSNVYYPGDDSKMESVMKGVATTPVLPYPTKTVRELIAGLSLCDFVICPDGGVMHLAAGLGKPIVCLFGIADPHQWHPWGTPHIVLRPKTRDVADISVNAVVEASQRLFTPKGM